MKPIWIPYALFLIVLSLPCSVFGAGVDKYQDLKSYFPMSKGSVWVYDFAKQSGGAIDSIKDCIKDDSDGIDVCVFMHSTFNGMFFSNAYSYIGDAVIERYRNENGNIKRSNDVALKSPLKVGGPTWSYTYNDHSKALYKVVKVLPLMEVKAGKFNNVIVVERIGYTKNKKNKWNEFKVDGEKIRQYSYYAPNVGLIGMGGQGMLIQELVEYRPSDPKQ